NYPAEKYALIISGHGGGWLGVGFDPTPGKACLTTECKKDPLYMGEISTALADNTGNNKLELIGFDSCNMGMIEVAYQVRPYANYMVASEEGVAGTGFPFEPWVGNLKANAQQWTGLELARDIVKQYGMFYSGPKPGFPAEQRDPVHTLSAI